MALGTEEANFNAEMDTLLGKWELVINAAAKDQQLQICFVKTESGDNPGNSKWGDDTTVPYDNKGPKHFMYVNPDVTGDMPFSVDGMPLFWKITNDLGELT